MPPIDFTRDIDTSVLKGKSALITGGANGLGAGMAKAMAEAGAYVTIADLNTDQGEALQKELQSKGLHVTFIKTDTVSWPSQTAAFKHAVSFSPTKSLDIVIPSAGLGGHDVLDSALPKDLPEDADLPAPHESTIMVNLVGVYYTQVLSLHYFAKTAKSSQQQQTSNGTTKKHLLFVASLAGYTGLPMSSEYNASKFGVRGLFKSLRGQQERLDFGFRCNLLAPTFIRTNMTKSIAAGLEARGIGLGEVEDFVVGAMRLCCDESIDGRAMCIAPNAKDNFDLCDDAEGEKQGSELDKKVAAGALGTGFTGVPT